jgi:hypothetical protein
MQGVALRQRAPPHPAPFEIKREMLVMANAWLILATQREKNIEAHRLMSHHRLKSRRQCRACPLMGSRIGILN